jgi:DNA gyrase subunit A
MLGQRDRVVGSNIAVEGQLVWNITDDGIAKVSDMAEYPTQGRAGGGVITMRLPKESREVVAAATGSADETIMVLTNKGKAKSMRLGAAPTIKRGRAGGSPVMRPTRKDEMIAAVVTYTTRFTAPEPDSEPTEPAETELETT